MAYALNALIAELALLRGALELPVIALPHGWGLVPLPQGSWRAEGHHARPLIHASECRLAPDDDFDEPNERARCIDHASTSFAWIAELCTRASARPGARLAYVEADSFGGRGNQAAAVWEAGQRVLGPIVEASAINQALARIGVLRRGFDDEFSTLELGRHRITEEWLQFA